MYRKSMTVLAAGMLTVSCAGAAMAAPGAGNWRQQGRRATTALNLLEEHSDGQFSNFTADGQDFSADVTKNGQIVHVTVYPDTGQVTNDAGAGI